MLPLILGRYALVRQLGQGGIGEVVEAFDTLDKQHVAIKTLRQRTDLNNVQQRLLENRFTREADVGRRLGKHQNIVEFHSFDRDEIGTPYLIMEYVPGGTLRDRISRGVVAISDGLRIARDIAAGLEVAHRAGIIHCDIKPANIFLDGGGRAKVGDFGIAILDHAAESRIPGTPLYMSPEQRGRSELIRPNTDQYSLGLVIFEMLTGKKYRQYDKTQIRTLLGTLPTGCAQLITRLTAERPQDRYPSMQIVTTVLDGMLSAQAEMTATGSEFALPDDTLAFHEDTPPLPTKTANVSRRRKPAPEAWILVGFGLVLAIVLSLTIATQQIDPNTTNPTAPVASPTATEYVAGAILTPDIAGVTARPSILPASSSSTNRDSAILLVTSYFDAINRRDFQAAYGLLGSDLRKTLDYTTFVQVFDTAAHDELHVRSATSVGVDKYDVEVEFDSLQTDGSIQRYAGTYTVGLEYNSLRIVDTNLSQLGVG